MAMKRRKRKRSSKAANPPTPKIATSDAEKPAEPLAALAEANRKIPPRDESIAPVEVEKPGNLSLIHI